MGCPVTGQAAPGGWRQRVEAFLRILLPDDLQGSHNTGVPLTWLRLDFGEFPPGADEHTVEQRVLNRREHLPNEVSPHLFLCC
jgi:hypothetical protein